MTRRTQHLLRAEVLDVNGDPVEVCLTDDDEPIAADLTGIGPRNFLPTYGGFRVGEEVSAIGSEIFSLDIEFGATETFDALISGYVIGGAKVSVWRVTYTNGGSGVLDPLWFGIVDDASMSDGPSSSRIWSIVNDGAREGTMNRAGRRSDASQRKRDPDDSFFEYGDMRVETASDLWES
ncbi:MAG: hypothetical protein HWE26_13665 [Alteromonadaceae bacterium]|nr:hypothetical protein [Alteromonadaceae bacterium]